MNELEDAYVRLRRVRRRLDQIPRDLEQRERAIQANDDLTIEAKRIKLRQVRDELRRKQQQLHAELVKTCDRADRLAEDAALEGGSRVAHERVRRLFSDRVLSSQIIARAEQMRDADTLRAVRAEVHYLGGEDGFVDERGTVDACNQALARLGQPEEDTLVAIGKEQVPAKALDEFAAKSVIGRATAYDRLSMAYAVGSEDDDA